MNPGHAKSVVLVAAFAAAAYLTNLALIFLPNVSLAFFVIFLAGYSLGAWSGMAAGALSFFFISCFNPYGMAMLPLLAAQIVGGGLVGLVGAAARKILPAERAAWCVYPFYAFCGLLASAIYIALVSVVDAVLFGPFRERFMLGLVFSMLTIVSNLFIFPALTPMIRPIREIVDGI